MFILLIFVSAAAAVLYLVSSLLQLLRGHARAGFWATFFIFTIVICALIALYETTPAPALVQTLALVIAAALIVVDLIFLVFELRLRPRALKTSRAILGIFAGVLIAVGVVAFPYRTLMAEALGQRTAAGAGGQGFGGQGALQNASFRPNGGGFGAQGAASTGEAAAPAAAVVTKPTEASQALEAETGLKVDDLLRRVSGGETIAALVQVHGGDLSKVTTALTNTVKQMVQDAVTAGTMQQAQADRMLGGLDQMVSGAVQGQLPAQFFDRLIAPAITGQPMTAGGFGGRGGGQGGAANGTAEAQPNGGQGGFGSGRNFGGNNANGTEEAQSGGGFGSGRNFGQQGANGTEEAQPNGGGQGGSFGSGRNFGGNNANGTPEAQSNAGGQGGSFGGNGGGFGGNSGGFGGNGGGFGAQAVLAPTATPTPFPTATPLPPRPTEPSPTPTNTPYVIATMTPEGTSTPGAASANADGSAGQSSNAASTNEQQCSGFTNHNVNLRSGPDTKTDVLMTVPASSQLQIDGRTDDSTWLAVTFNDKSGWMDAKYVDLVGRCSALPVKTS